MNKLKQYYIRDTDEKVTWIEGFNGIRRHVIPVQSNNPHIGEFTCESKPRGKCYTVVDENAT